MSVDRFVQISLSSKDPLGLGAQDQRSSVYLGGILRTVPRADIKLLLNILGFSRYTIEWTNPPKNQEHADLWYHEGWCCINFPEALSANRARTCLEGLDFRGQELITGLFSINGAPSSTKLDYKPPELPTLAQLLEPARVTEVVHHKQLDSNDNSSFLEHQKVKQLDQKEHQGYGNDQIEGSKRRGQRRGCTPS